MVPRLRDFVWPLTKWLVVLVTESPLDLVDLLGDTFNWAKALLTSESTSTREEEDEEEVVVAAAAAAAAVVAAAAGGVCGSNLSDSLIGRERRHATFRVFR